MKNLNTISATNQRYLYYQNLTIPDIARTHCSMLDIRVKLFARIGGKWHKLTYLCRQHPNVLPWVFCKKFFGVYFLGAYGFPLFDII